MSAPTSESIANLDLLPLELLWDILSYLPVSSLVAVKLVNKRLFCSAPEPPLDWLKDASYCEKQARRRYLNERRNMDAGRRKCINCNLATQSNRFASSAAPLCKWHAPRCMSNSIPEYLDTSIKHRLANMARDKQEPRWVRIDRVYCAHDREIVGWHSPEPSCDCESCGHFSVPCYVRIPSKLNTTHWRCSNMSPDGLFIHEEHWVHGDLFETYRQTVPVLSLES